VVHPLNFRTKINIAIFKFRCNPLIYSTFQTISDGLSTLSTLKNAKKGAIFGSKNDDFDPFFIKITQKCVVFAQKTH
jgi:hypothetical protein